MSGRVIVLDAGGVLLTEPVPLLLREMAERGGTDPAAVDKHFHENLYYPLWSGQLSSDEFWGKLRAVSHAPCDNAYWEQYFLSQLRPSGAMKELIRLRGADRVVVLSNHLSRWLRPHLQDPLERGLIDDVLISSETGHVKPKPEAFLDVFTAVGAPNDREILLVDDRPGNLRAAARMGWSTLLGSEDADWIARAENWVARGLMPA